MAKTEQATGTVVWWDGERTTTSRVSNRTVTAMNLRFRSLRLWLIVT